jgi:hypothetical protein
LKYYAFGGHWGYRGKLSEKIKFTFRIGADYPVNTLTWDKDPPDKIGAFSKNGISNIIKLTSYIDSQLSIFIVF